MQAASLPLLEKENFYTMVRFKIYMLTIRFTSKQESRCPSPMSQFAIFFLDWQLKSASGDFFGA
jgi:hypothetical protein